MNLEGKWTAIWVGAAITGLVPLVPLFRLACCLIPFAGAFVAVAIYSNSVPRPSLNNNDGVMMGLTTGLIGAVLHAIILIPTAFLLGHFIGGFANRLLPMSPDLPERLAPFLQGIFSHFGGILAFVVISIVLGYVGLSLVFGILGGIVAVAVFRRRPAAPPVAS